LFRRKRLGGVADPWVFRDAQYAATVMKALCGGLVVVVLWPALASGGQTDGGVWQELAPMPTARQELATAVLNGKIYVIGGYDKDGNSTDTVEVYNPNTNTWASAHPIPTAQNHNSAAVAAGQLYSFGGASNRTYVYDPLGDSWSEVAMMNYGHASTPAVGVINNKIYVAGGVGGGNNRLEVYDPVTNTWTERAPMSVPRNHCGGGVIDGKLYVVGGRDTPQSPTALEVYDPQSNAWAALSPMPTGRSGIGVGAVNGELWVFGGETTFGGNVEVYNPVNNSWRQLPAMPVPRHGIWASVIGNRIYLPGGGIVEGFGATTWNDVFIVEHQATFANISTRLKVETGDNVLIGGFIVTGSASKRVILRALGPSLPVSGPLVNPALELYDGAGQLVAVNNDWQAAPNKQEIMDSALAPSLDWEAAILRTVAPGNYTTIVRGEGNTTGVALVEVYDLEAGSEAKLANISTRGLVQTGDNVLIGGVILRGELARRVIVRAIGPSLPVPGALADPTLELRDTNGALLALNDNWRTTQEAEIIATGVPPSHNLESAIVQTLPASNYTAIVRGQNATTGIALVEAYALE
jgi:N-acetylneuraminic acid mutarotase